MAACVCVRLYVCVCQCACVSVRLTLNCLEEQRKIRDNFFYKMTLINLSSGLKNGRWYSILGNVNVYTHGWEIRT